MRSCLACGKRFGAEARFCSRCGMARPVATLGATRLERRYLTVLFCDLVGSTELAAAVDPEHLASIILTYRTTMQFHLATSGGTVSQFVGDGILAYFGFPHAQDDDAARAVGAALEMVGSMPALNRRFRIGSDGDLRIRIGICSGMSLIELADTSGPGLASVGAIGQVPNIAARLQAAAEPNTVLVGAETRARSEAAFAFEPVGPLKLKGIPERVAAFRPVSERDRSRPAPVGEDAVSRKRELADLYGRWNQAVAGRGCHLLLVGDAGMGKTFATNRLAEHAAAAGGLVLRFNARFDAAYSPYRTVVEGLGRILMLGTGPPAARRRRLRRVLRLSGQDGAGHLPLLCEFLSLPAPDPAPLPPLTAPPLTDKGRRLLLLSVLLAWLGRLAAQRPVLLLVDNTHWLDPSSEEWLAALLRAEPVGRLMVVATVRPPASRFWDAFADLPRLSLDRLDDAGLARMLDTLDPAHAIPGPLRGDLVRRSDGVPLFLEELVKHVRDGGSLDADGMGGSIPDSLRSMLTARLDRLGAAKPIALAASVVGRSFQTASLEVLLARRRDAIPSALDRLVAVNIFGRESGRETGRESGREGDRYHFTHALLRNAAYDSLLGRVRREYHARLAHAYPSFAPDTAAEQPELVAMHASLGGLHRRASDLWADAGRRALGRSLFREASAHFSHALTHADALAGAAPRRRAARLCMELASAKIGAEGFAAPDVERLSLRARDIYTALADRPGLDAALGGLTTFYQVRGPLDRARALAETLVRSAAERGDGKALIRARRRLGWCLFCMGEIAAGKALLETVLDDHARLRTDAPLDSNEIDAGVIGFVNLGWAECLGGNVGRGLHLARSGRALATRLGRRPADMAYSLAMSAAISQSAGDPDGTARNARRAITVATANALPYWRAWSTVLLGWSIIPTDPAAAARTVMEGIAAYRRTGARLFQPYNLGLAADALHRSGRPRTALLLLDRAAAEASSTGARFSEASLLACRAAVLATLGTR